MRWSERIARVPPMTSLRSGLIRCLRTCAVSRASKRSPRKLFPLHNSDQRPRRNESAQFLRRAEAAQCLQSRGRIRRRRLASDSNRDPGLSVFRNSKLGGAAGGVALIIGFPVALVLAWAFEITPEGIKRTEDVDHSQPPTYRTGRTLDFLIIAVLLVIIGVFAYQRFGLSQKTSVSVSAIPEKSIAVLPFENRSRDPDNAYFADGIQDEILTRLAKIADLKVISRTSTQHYKSAPENLPEIARQLGVAHIVEGSVQKSSDSVRVNVQLIKAANDSHLWADTFDRKLTDIFSVESDVAKAIADQLRVKLSGREEQVISAKPTDNPEAYDAYLRGRYFWNKRTSDGIKHAIEHFQQSIERDP